MSNPSPQRIVLAKIGLDGHDRGIKVVARGLRDAGLHVIYGGLWQPLEAVVQAVRDEDADWLGISMLSGAHMTLVPQLMQQLKDAQMDHVGVLVGGIIPDADIERLKQIGVAGLFGPGTSIEEIVDFVHRERPAVDMDWLFEQFRGGDRRALSRLVSLAGRDEHASEIRERLDDGNRECPLVGVTGNAGVGKSSLIRKLVEQLKEEEKSVAVLACDPQSPVSGGALLGDRIRMAGAADSGVFIRSLATPSGHQALAANLDLMADLLADFGFDFVLLETVGAGQGDTALRQVADVVVLLVQPQTGDELQWEKAGLIEVADVVVVNKSDLPGAEQVRADLASQLASGPRPAAVLCTSVTKSEGLAELLAAIAAAAR